MANEDLSLPPEYMAEIDAANKKRAIAQLLQKRALGFQGAPTGGRVAAKTSPLAWMANAATGYLGTQADSAGATAAREVQNRASTDQRNETSGILALPEDQQFPTAMKGRFSQTQALGKLLQEQKEKRLGKFAETVRDADPTAGATALINNRLPGNYSMPAIEAPAYGTAPDGTATVTTTNRKGEKEVKYAPKGIQFTLPTKEADAALDFHKQDLTLRKADATTAKDVLATNSRVIDALEQGAQAGGGQDYMQTLRKVGQAFGINAPDTATTEQLGMALGEAVLAQAGKLKPVSNQDMKDLAKIVGAISTDPTALTKAIAFSNALALKGLSGYNNYVGEQTQKLSSPYARDLFSGANIGYEMPDSLYGPMPFQLETIRNLQRIGGDVSRFRDPAGRAFTSGDKFNVNATGGMPGINPSAQEPKPKGWENLTPVQQKRYLELKARQKGGN